MRGGVACWLAVTALGCGSVSAKSDGSADRATNDGAAGSEAGPDGAAEATAPDTGAGTDGADSGPAPACSPTSPFGAATALAGLNSTTRDDGLSLSPDGLTAYIASFRAGTIDNIYTASRSAAGQPFSTPALLTSVMSATAFDFAPRISTDGLRLYFSSTRNGGMSHIFLATRTSLATDFAAASQLAVINSTADDRDEHLTSDERTIVFASTRTGAAGSDIYLADRPGTGTFATPVRIAELASPGADFLPVLADDRLTIYFGSDRADAPAKGGADIWMARRSSPGGSFGAPQNVAELNTATEDDPLWLSPDGCTLYFISGPVTNTDFYQATRGP